MWHSSLGSYHITLKLKSWRLNVLFDHLTLKVAYYTDKGNPPVPLPTASMNTKRKPLVRAWAPRRRTGCTTCKCADPVYFSTSSFSGRCSGLTMSSSLFECAHDEMITNSPRTIISSNIWLTHILGYDTLDVTRPSRLAKSAQIVGASVTVTRLAACVSM